MKGFPRELLDAARVDGASSWRTLWQVVVPNLRAPLAALAILIFISTWKEYFWPLLVTSKPEQSVVQVGPQMFLTQEGDAWGPMMPAPPSRAFRFSRSTSCFSARSSKPSFALV